MKSSLKIGLTCFMGAVIGTLIGLQFSSWVGLLISIISGALAGYLLWEIKTVIHAIPKAWKAAKTTRMPKVDWKKLKISIIDLFVFFWSMDFSCISTLVDTHSIRAITSSP